MIETIATVSAYLIGYTGLVAAVTAPMMIAWFEAERRAGCFRVQ